VLKSARRHSFCLEICRDNFRTRRGLSANAQANLLQPGEEALLVEWSRDGRERVDSTHLLYVDLPKVTSFVTALEQGIVCGTDVTQTEDQSTPLIGGVWEVFVGPNRVR
jgi:hypothetical protein